MTKKIARENKLVVEESGFDFLQAYRVESIMQTNFVTLQNTDRISAAKVTLTNSFWKYFQDLLSSNDEILFFLVVNNDQFLGIITKNGTLNLHFFKDC